MDQEAFERLADHFSTLPDPRDLNRRHKLLDIVGIGICAVIAGAESFDEMEAFGLAKEQWLRGFLELPHGIPSHDTFLRVFSALDPVEFERCFENWVRAAFVKISGEKIAIDGKSLRGSRDGENNCLQLVSAFARSNRLILAQLKTREDSNEIEAIPRLLDSIDIRGAVVTIDAIGCQRTIAQKIIEKGGDYCLCLKANQKDFLSDVEFFFDREELPIHETVDADHGRVETRRYTISSEVDWIAYKDQWKGLRSIGMVQRAREVKGEKSMESHYFISSLPADLKIFSDAVRGHWEIENSVHWVLDVAFREDHSRIRDKNAAHNVAVLRRMALNMLRRDRSKGSVKGKRLRAAWDNAFLQKVLTA